MNPTKLVAHRGDNTHYPENSFTGLKAALQYGALFVEFDVQMCADNTLILLHDSDFKRTANIRLSVFDATLSDIQNISIHEPDRFAQQHYPTPVSSLSDTLELLCDFPAATAFVEIKEESLAHYGIATVMDQLLIDLAPYSSQSVLISFSNSALEYAQQCTTSRTGWVMTDYNEAHRQRARDLNPDYLICHHEKITGTAPWPGDWEWMVYSIDDCGMVQQMINKGIDLVETNNIRKLLAESCD